MTFRSYTVLMLKRGFQNMLNDGSLAVFIIIAILILTVLLFYTSWLSAGIWRMGESALKSVQRD